MQTRIGVKAKEVKKWNVVKARWSLNRKLAILSASMAGVIYAVTGTRDISVVFSVTSFFGVISEPWCDYVIRAKREGDIGTAPRKPESQTQKTTRRRAEEQILGLC